MKRMQRGRAGVTIAEALVSMMLVLMITGIITNIVGRWSHIFKFSDERLERIETVSTSLSTIRGEIEGALEVVSPDSTSSTSSLVIEQISPEYTFPGTLTLTPTGWSWEEAPSDWSWDDIVKSTITYSFDGEELRRTDSGGANRLVDNNLSGFAARRLDSRNIEVSMSIVQGEVVQVFRMEAWRP